MKSLFRIFAILVFVPIILSSCMGPKKLTTDQTFLNLQPVEQLPIYDLESVPINFEAIIENVADMSSSYKNRAAFYINDHLIVPDEEITNVQSKYIYRLKLQPGIYNIRGEYYALDGFAERTFQIKPQTKVMVQPEQITKVYYNIEKNWDGTPLHDKMLFTVSYTSLTKMKEKLKVVEEKTAPPQQKIQRRAKRPGHVRILPVPDKNDRMITLQIKTAPSNADVLIDNEFIGKSPLRVMVDRTNDHEIQISKRGYEEVIKYLDRNKFGNEKTIHLIQKLIPR